MASPYDRCPVKVTIRDEHVVISSAGKDVAITPGEALSLAVDIIHAARGADCQLNAIIMALSNLSNTKGK